MLKLFATVIPFLVILTPLFLSAQTVLYPGDLVVVGLASNVGGELGDCTPDGNGQFTGRDRVSFFSFKTIESGTSIDITDNGWERENPGQWGNTEGFIRATRTGGAIPAGTVITFELPPTTSGYLAVSPDAEWEFTLLGTNALNFNDSGDQIYFMQGGTWDNGTVLGCCNGEQDASYSDGRILFGFNSRSTWNAFFQDSQNSGLHPDVIPCFNMSPTSGITSFTSYSGPLSETTQLEWIARIANPDNWTAYGDCPSYQDPAASFPIGPSGMSIACTVCQACERFQDTLTFNLPENGGPFTVDYTDGTDTFQLANIAADEQVVITVDTSVTYRMIRVADAQSCPIYSNFDGGAELSVSQGPPVLNCEPGSAAPNGSVIFSVSGGQPPFTIRWTDEQGISGTVTGDGSASITVNGLQAQGLYQVAISDVAGCTNSCEFTLDGPDCNLSVLLEGTSPGCNDPNSGSVTTTVSGQTGNLSYLWNDSSLSGPDQFSIPGGTYSVTVSDEAGCTDSARVELLDADRLDVQLELVQSVSCDLGWGLRILDISGGNPPFSVQLDPTAQPMMIPSLPLELTDLIAGNYNLIFEDQSGCQQPVAITIPSGNSGRTLILDLGFDTNVQRGQGVRIDPIINFEPSAILWSPTTSVEDPTTLFTTLRPEATTLYTATATDFNGCSVSDSILIRVSDQENIFIPSAFSPNNDGVNDLFLLYPGPEISQIHALRVFDRWGTMVYHSEDTLSGSHSIGWDGNLPGGRPASGGTYFYFTELEDTEGRIQIVKGTLTLIR